MVSRARQLLAGLLNAPDSRRIIFTTNGTGALNLALHGYLRPGDRVVTTSLEHNAVARPLSELAKRGIVVVRVPCPGGRFHQEPFLAAIQPGDRLVVMTHASNVTGEVLPVEEVARHCRSVGVPLLLDAAQTAGSLPLDVRALGVDLVAMPGHKGLFGPPGTGALYIGEGIELRPLTQGGTGSFSEQEEQPEALPDRFESGTLNTGGLAGLAAALEWIRDTGPDRIRQEERARLTQLWEGLSTVPGIRLHGPPPTEERAAALSLTLEGWEPGDAGIVLDQSFDIQCRPGLHCAPWAHRSLDTFPTGTIRLSPGFFNTEAEVESVIQAIHSMSALQSAPVF